MFSQHLRDVLRQVVNEKDAVDASVSVSDRPDLSDYQSNIALRLAGKRRKPAMEIAQEIAQSLINHADMSETEVSVAPPGFINVRLKDPAIVACLNHEDCLCARVEKPRKIVMDYGAPNLAKPLHVGHLRSAVLGESVKRVLRSVGHTVLGDVHLGDWGTQMGKVLYGLDHAYPDLYDEASELTFSFDALEECYKVAVAAFDADPEAAKVMSSITFALQQGEPKYQRVWQRVRDLSVENIQSIYRRLDVSFDMWYGESRYQPVMPGLCADFLEKGFARLDNGALIADVDVGSKPKIPPVILQKSDGGYLYATTDMATVKERVVDLEAQSVIYVVDARQSLHFEQVFRLARKVGWNSDFVFLAFGTVNGDDGKPFKTRDGGTFKLEDLLDALKQTVQGYAQEKGRELDEHAIETIALSALKIGDLQQDLRHNYVFSVEKFAQFEGCTGPYLLYTCARLCSLLAKGDDDSERVEGVFSAEERVLAILLLQYKETILFAAQKYAPHILCQYAFALAGAFNALYQKNPILQANPAQRSARLALCRLTQQALCHVLDLLGIKTLERM